MAYPKYAIPDDWEAIEDGYLAILFCCPNSQKWRGLITAHVEWLTQGRLWNGQTGNIKSTQAIGREIFNSMSMCDLEQLTIDVERIATALEAIEAKAIERYTYEEFIEDLEDAFGIGSIIGQIVGGLVGLMPRLQAKVDFGPIALSFIETLTRWRPIHLALIGINASLAAIAATLATGKIISIIQALIAALGIVGNGWKNLLFGDLNIYDDVLKPIWDTYVKDEQGGLGGNDPDNDPENRITVKTTNKIANKINISIDTCCYDIGDHPANDVEELEQPDPETPPVTWEGTLEQYNEYKCKAANLLPNAYVFYIRAIAGIEGLIAGGSVPALMQLFTSTQIMPLIFAQFVLAAGPLLILAYLITVIVAGAGFAAALLAYANDLENDYDSVVCELYNSLNITEARMAIETWMNNSLPGLLPASWVDAHIEHWYPANVLNALFTEYQSVVDFDESVVDCTECEEASCGLTGLPQHMSIFSNVGDGMLDFSGDIMTITGTTEAPPYGYRYSGWFGGTWGSTPYPARRILSVDCSPVIDGSPADNRFALLGPNGVSFATGTYDDLPTINAMLAAGTFCCSIVYFAYADAPAWFEATFEEV